MRAKTLADIPPEDVEPLDLVKARMFAGMIDVAARNGDTILPANKLAESISTRMGGEKLPAMLNIMIKRLEQTDLLYSEEVVVFLSLLVGNKPGKAVMWAYTIFENTGRGNGPLTMDRLFFMFPNGFPTEAAYEAIWTHQKQYDGATSNWLDTAAAWTA